MTMTLTLIAQLLGALLHPALNSDGGQLARWLGYADDLTICLAHGDGEANRTAILVPLYTTAMVGERLGQLEQFASLNSRLARVEALLQSLVEAQTRPPRPAQEWFSVDEVAALTGLSADHVRRHVVSGQLPVSNQGRYDKPYYRIHRRDVDEWMAKRRESPSPAPRGACRESADREAGGPGHE